MTGWALLRHPYFRDSGAIYDRNGVLLYDGQTKKLCGKPGYPGCPPFTWWGTRIQTSSALGAAGPPADRL